jgi:hypothetical protein
MMRLVACEPLGGRWSDLLALLALLAARRA